MMFGWRKYSWVNKNSYEVVSSTRGIIDKPQYAEYMKNLDHKNQIEFYTKICSNKGNSLKIIDNLFNPIAKKYLGLVVLE